MFQNSTKFELMLSMNIQKLKLKCCISLQDLIESTACVTTFLLEATDDALTPKNSIN